MNTGSMECCGSDEVIMTLRRELKLSERRTKKLGNYLDSKLAELRSVKKMLGKAKREIEKMNNAKTD